MREKEKTTRVIYVRHGQTDYPLDRIYCDSKEDPELSSLGIEQAEQAAKFLEKQEVAAIYASPCLRTSMTAEAIAKFHTHPVKYDDALVERNFGDWEGLYFHEIESQFPSLYKEWKQNQAAFKPVNGESVYDLAARVGSAKDRIIEEFAGRCVVVVSHVGPIRVLVADALEMPVERYRQLSIEPASLTQIDYGASQNNMILLNFHARHWGI